MSRVMPLMLLVSLVSPVRALGGPFPDCNSNGVHDLIDIAAGTSANCNGNAIPDECELAGDDCNTNAVPDSCEIAAGTATDCDTDGIADECELASGTQTDCDFNTVPDDCERPSPFDCNLNGQDDACDIAQGISNDFDGDGLPDECGKQQCTSVWAGFENTPFIPGVALDGLDSDTNGDAWSNITATGQVVAGGCPVGSGGNAVRNTGDDALAVSASVTSELFAGSIGSLPPSAPLVRVSFDYRLQGDLGAGYDHRLLLVAGDTGQLTTLLWFGLPNSDLGVNGAGAGDDATPGQLWVLTAAGVLVDTGVVLDLNVCHHVEVALNTVGALIDISVDAQPVFSGASLSASDRIDRVVLNAIRHAGAVPGGPNLSLVLDNFQRCVSGAPVSCTVYDSLDCDGNNICDVFEPAGDTDTDGVLDVCEDYCDDCNNNTLRDAAEIAAGSAADVNTNGIIDDCEALSPADSFEGLSLTPIAMQGGWTEIGDTASIVADSARSTQNPAFPTDGTQFLLVQDNPALGAGSSFLMGPRSELLAEADIELWCWDMFVTSNNFGSVFVEITDLCREFTGSVFLPGGARNLGGLISAANTGLEFRGSAATAPANVVRMLSNPGGGKTYGTVSAGDQSMIFGSVARTACIKIKNDFGITEALYGPVGMDPPNLALVAVGQIETGQPIALPGGGQQPAGGDRQWIIRTDGVDNGTEFWFDNLRYSAFTDCDRDGIRDTLYIGLDPQMDANIDGVIDTCQDCNADCPSFPVADTSCLDPVEIASCPMGNSACADCNANNIPDECDVDPSLPLFGVPASCPLLPGCLASRLGGGSCDADANGVPDECQVAASSATDCNANGCVDSADITAGTSVDVDGNNLPDECDPDCNHNGVIDALDISGATSTDGDTDGVPDECCPVLPSADFDADGDVDAFDYQRLQQCAGVVARPTDPPDSVQFVGCGCADLDASGTVDDQDVRRFQQSITGP